MLIRNNNKTLENLQKLYLVGTTVDSDETNAIIKELDKEFYANEIFNRQVIQAFKIVASEEKHDECVEQNSKIIVVTFDTNKDLQIMLI